MALNAAKALKESGHDVTIFTCTPINADEVKRMFNVDVSGFDVVVRRFPIVGMIERFSRGRLSVLRRLMGYKRYFRFFSEYVDEVGKDCELVVDTQSIIISPADISYIHYPALTYLYEKKGTGIHRRLYDWAVKLYADRLMRGIIPGRALTNSSWTAAKIYKVHHIVADVVYPPVDVEYFSRVADNDRREKLVVTVSRFHVEKRLDMIVDVAARLRDYTFVLIGSAREFSYGVLDEIGRKVEEYRLDNVVVETNLPRSKVLEYLRDARFYLHPPYPEHFGIAVVEAMAAGLVPLVYRDGGAWHDVVSGVWGMLGYEAVEEVPKMIRHIDSDSGLRGELRRRSVEVSKMFSYENFKRSLIDKVGYMMKVKRFASGYRGSCWAEPGPG